MKRPIAILTAIILLARLVSATAQEPPPADPRDASDAKAGVIDGRYASLEVGILLQAGYDVLPNQVDGERNSFGVRRVRLGLSGHLMTRSLGYEVVLDALGASRLAVRSGGVGSETLAGDESDPAPFLLDARLVWDIEAIGARLSIGRFVPLWGLSMPAKVSETAALLYPLYVHGAPDSLGHFRKIGIEAEFTVTRRVDFGGGVYNGGVNSWLDTSDRKDVLAYLTIRPFTGFVLRASSLFAFANLEGAGDADEVSRRTQTRILPIAEARYVGHGINAMIGGALGFILPDGSVSQGEKSHKAVGAMGEIGVFVVGDWFELFGRVEWWEPNDTVARDDQWRLTIGPNFRLDGVHGQIGVNYVQDLFAGRDRMCTSYLQLAGCEVDQTPLKEASRYASTLLFLFGIDI